MPDYKDKIPGGLGDKKRPEDFDKDQLQKGIEVELEHTNDRDLAREIAIDHLTEHGDYYTALEKMEKNLERQSAFTPGMDLIQNGKPQGILIEGVFEKVFGKVTQAWDEWRVDIERGGILPGVYVTSIYYDAGEGIVGVAYSGGGDPKIWGTVGKASTVFELERLLVHAKKTLTKAGIRI